MSIENFVATKESEGKTVVCNGMVGDVRVLVTERRGHVASEPIPYGGRFEVYMGNEESISGAVDVVDWHRRRDGGTTVIATSWGDQIILWRRIGQTPRDLYNGEPIV